MYTFRCRCSRRSTPRKKSELDKKSEDLENETEKAGKLLNEKIKELEESKKLFDEQKQAFKDAEEMEGSLSEQREELSDSEKELKEKQTELEAVIALTESKEAELSEQYAKLTEAKNGLAAIKEPLEQLRQLNASLSDASITKVIEFVSGLLVDLKYPVLTEDVELLRTRLAEAQKEGLPERIDKTAESVADFIVSVDSEIKAGIDRLTSDEMREQAERIAEMPELPTGDSEYAELIALLADHIREATVSPEQLTEVYELTVNELTELRRSLDELNIPQTAAKLRSIDAVGSAEKLGVLLQAIEERTRTTDTSGQTLSQIYNGILKSVSDMISELEAKRAQILAELARYGIAEDGIDAALWQLDQGIKECRSQRTKAKNGLTEVRNGIGQIEDGIAELDEALEKLRDELSKNSSELNNAEKDLQNAEDELDREIVRALDERSEIEKELEDAYKLLDENTGYDELCNEFLLYFDGSADADALLEKAAASFGNVKVKSSYTYADSAVKKRIDENLDPIRTMMVFLPAAFFAIVLIVIFLFMSMIIKQSRREIGILRALGFIRGQVRAEFCKVSLVVCAAGLIPGALIAAGLSMYVGSYFKDFFPLPEFFYDIGFAGIALPAAATAAVTLGATLLSTGQISRIMPDEAMSRQVRASAKIPALLRPAVNSLRPMAKVSVTSLMRSKGRFVISTVCIAASATLILTAFSFIASKNYTVHQVFDERIKYDCQIFLEKMPSDGLINELGNRGYTVRTEKLAYWQTDISANGKSRQTAVNAIEENSTLIGITDGSGKELRVGRGGIVLERHIADELGVDVGGTVTVKGRDLTVTAVSDQCVDRIQYISLADAQTLCEPDLCCLVCTLSGDCKQELLTLLFDTEGYQYSVFTAALYDYNTELYATYDLAAWIVIAFAVVIGFVIVFNTMLTNLHENKKELAILRTLGFQHREISRSRLLQALLQFALACLIGFPLGGLLARAALASISTPLTEYVYVGGILEYVFTGGIILAYLLVSHLISMRSMKKWDVTEIVKDKE